MNTATKNMTLSQYCHVRLNMKGLILILFAITIFVKMPQRLLQALRRSMPVSFVEICTQVAVEAVLLPLKLG